MQFLGLGLGEERGQQVRAGQAEGEVLGRARAGPGVAGVEVRRVDDAVDAGGLLLAEGLHRFHAALVPGPFQHQLVHPDVEDIGRAGHGAGLGQHPVAQLPRDLGQGLLQQVVADDDHRLARGAQVLLEPGVEHAELGRVHLAREDLRGEIAHQRHRQRVRKFLPARAHHGVVGGDVQVSRPAAVRATVLTTVRAAVRAAVHHGRVKMGNVVEAGFLAADDHLHLAEAARLLDGHLGEKARVGIQRFSLRVPPHQVQGHRGELHRSPAVRKQHLVVFRQLQQLAEEGLGLGDDLHEVGLAVVHLDDRHSGALVVQELRPHLLHHRYRQHGRPRSIIENLLAHRGLIFPDRMVD